VNPFGGFTPTTTGPAYAPGGAQEVWGVKFDGIYDPNQAEGWHTFCTSRWLLVRPLGGTMADPQVQVNGETFTAPNDPAADERVVHTTVAGTMRPYVIR
jgi:hypothetical protein